MSYVWNVFSFIYMIIWYLLFCIGCPIGILPFLLINKIINNNVKTNYWGYIVNYVFFPMFNIRYNVDGEFIDRGFILANHRTWCDFAYDPYISDSAIIGRTIAFIIMLFESVLGLLDNRFIIINRKNSRTVIFQQILNFMNSNSFYKNRILFYPEGTRKNYKKITIDEIRQIIKPGLLKSIYEHQELPVQLMISSNKEKVFNEKKISVSIGETICTKLSEPIHPKSYETFELFLDKIHNEWVTIFSDIYKNKVI